ERVQLREMTVVKSGGRKQPFDRDKIIKSMQIALRKRPILMDKIEKVVTGIVRVLESQGEQEIGSAQIGAEVMRALKELDVVGYIRYASVYKDFREPDDFNDFVEDLQKIQSGKRGAA
ncbi:MAG TPA: ATP cone domain-containing protein, partial [Alphaproteobacteria bacterium]|nr:ATP cone domain-containing protein [Alphaproteobacteria bacterium]